MDFDDFWGNYNTKLCLPKNSIALYYREFISLQDGLLFVFFESQQRDQNSKYYRGLCNDFEKVHPNSISLLSKTHFQVKPMSYSKSAPKTE